MGRIKEAMKRLTHIITLIFLVLFISNGLPEEDVHLHLNLSISDFGEKSKTPDSQNRFLRTCSCGKAPKTGANRVIGGTEARPHEFPWMVRIVGGCAMDSCGGALKNAARFSDKVNSICLPKPGQDFSGKMAVAAGWGAFAPPHIREGQSDVLRKVNLQVSHKKYNHYNMFGTKIEEKHRWGSGRYTDPCAGDSGGPLMYWNRWAQHYELIGTVNGLGYDCTSGKVRRLEGSTNGVWNKVSNWVTYIRRLMRSMGETACQSRYL